jgi:hypothetical protein
LNLVTNCGAGAVRAHHLIPPTARMLNVTTIDSNAMEFRDSIRARAISCYWFELWPKKSKVVVQSMVRFDFRRGIGKGVKCDHY